MGNVTEVAVSGFKWVENRPHFNKDSIEIYNQDSDERCFLEVDFQ